MSSEFYAELIANDDHVLSARKLLLELSINDSERSEQRQKMDEILDDRLLHMQARDRHEINELIREALDAK